MPLRAIPLSESFFPSNPDISIYDCVFPVVRLSEDGRATKLIGTCFAISACGMYATAAHLFDEFSSIQRHLRENGNTAEQLRIKGEELRNADDMRCGIVHFRRDSWLGITRIDALTMCISHDVAFLFAANDLRGRNQPFLPIIETPASGDTILVVGYPGSHNTMNIVGGDTESLEFDLALVDSTGTITEAFPTGRDRTLAHYPCFTTSATMRNGQSGGPVLDMARMGVVGINSRSFDGLDDYCVVSWLGRALDIPFGFDDMEFRSGDGRVLSVRETTLRKLAREGITIIK